MALLPHKNGIPPNGRGVSRKTEPPGSSPGIPMETIFINLLRKHLSKDGCFYCQICITRNEYVKYVKIRANIDIRKNTCYNKDMIRKGDTEDANDT